MAGLLESLFSRGVLLFSLKASLLLLALNVPLYLLALLGLPLPPLAAAAAISWFSAYYLAWGRRVFPLAAYGLTLASALVDVYLRPGVLQFRVLLFPVAAAVGVFALLAYAATMASGWWRLASPVALWLAVGLATLPVAALAVPWRAAVPVFGLAPLLPEPQDLPLYVLAYWIWRLIHGAVLARSPPPPPRSRLPLYIGAAALLAAAVLAIYAATQPPPQPPDWLPPGWPPGWGQPAPGS